MLKAILGCFFAVATVLLASRASATPATEQCASQWARVRPTMSITAYQAFIRDYTQCDEVREARELLRLAAVPTMGDSSPPLDDRSRYAAVGNILPRGSKMVAEGGGYGIVLLRPSVGRKKEACEVMLRSLTFKVRDVDQRAEAIDGFSLYRRPVYWPTLTDRPELASWNCAAMIASYDYERAWLNFAALGQSDRKGPFVAVVAQNGTQAALFDFSNVPSDEFSRQFDIVLSYLSRDATIWKTSYYQAGSMRQRMRKFLVDDNEAANLVIASLFGLSAPADAKTEP